MHIKSTYVRRKKTCKTYTLKQNSCYLFISLIIFKLICKYFTKIAQTITIKKSNI